MKRITLVILTLMNMPLVKASSEVPTMTSFGGLPTQTLLPTAPIGTVSLGMPAMEMLPAAEAPQPLNPIEEFYSKVKELYTKGAPGTNPFKDMGILKEDCIKYWKWKEELFKRLKEWLKIGEREGASASFESERKNIIESIKAWEQIHTIIMNSAHAQNFYFADTYVAQVIGNVSQATGVNDGWFGKFAEILENLEKNQPIQQDIKPAHVIKHSDTNEFKKRAIDLYYTYFSDLSREEINKITAIYPARAQAFTFTLGYIGWPFLIRQSAFSALAIEIENYKIPVFENFQGAFQIALEQMSNFAQSYAGSDIVECIKELNQWSIAEKNYLSTLRAEKDSIGQYLPVRGLGDLVTAYLENNFSSEHKMHSIILEADKPALKCDFIFKLDTIPYMQHIQALSQVLNIDYEKIKKEDQPFRFQDYFVAKLQYMSWLCDMPDVSLRSRFSNQESGFSRKTRQRASFEIIDTAKGYIWSTELIECIKKTNYLPSKEFYDYVMNFPVVRNQAQRVVSANGQYIVAANLAK